MLNDMFSESLYFGVVLSILAYWLGVKIHEKFPYTLVNPMLIAMAFIILFLLILGIDYDTYYYGAKYISFLLTPATVCLAVPLYKQFKVLKQNWAALLVGIISGCIAFAVSLLILCWIFKADAGLYHSLQSKSVTTAIAIGISEELGGNPTITICAVSITGLFGVLISKIIFKLFKITNPIAIGLALGNSCHVLGTGKAFEYGELEGAVSSLSIVIAGLFTVILASVFAGFY